jgi:hypothetical protein
MRLNNRLTTRLTLIISMLLLITLVSTRLRADTGSCGGVSVTVPFTDVMGSIFFCSIAEAYFSALTNGTDPTHYSPSANVTRDQMAAFITRTLDQGLVRGSKRAALGQFWTTQTSGGLGITDVGTNPAFIKSDGRDVWVANNGNDTVSRVKGSDGNLIDTWTGATNANATLVARGKIFVVGKSTPHGSLYSIDPQQPAGPVTLVTSDLGNLPANLAYDGQHIWTANAGGVSIVQLSPVSVTTVGAGLGSPFGILFDGTNIWVTDFGDNTLKRLDSNGAVTLTTNVGATPRQPVFDGTNIWVPSAGSNSVTVVRAVGGFAGTVLATLSGNGLNGPTTGAFDGARILVTNFEGDRVSLWNASDFSPIDNIATGSGSEPWGACSDGVNFWIALLGTGKLARF